jgi:hypothetical protein
VAEHKLLFKDIRITQGVRLRMKSQLGKSSVSTWSSNQLTPKAQFTMKMSLGLTGRMPYFASVCGGGGEFGRHLLVSFVSTQSFAQWITRGVKRSNNK